MKVLLTGASGLLGTWMLRTAPTAHEVVAVTHRRQVPRVAAVRADLRQAASVSAAVRLVGPSLVVHAAYAQDRASIVEATRHVTAAASDVGADVVLISTDAVFSGDGRARDESATPDPVSDYGRWKSEAERIVLDQTNAGTVVRLSLVVSLDPEDHVVERIRSAAEAGMTTSWFSDEFRQPANAAELAAAIWRIGTLDPDDRRGVWHLPGSESLTRHDIALRVVAALDLDASAIRPEPTPAGAARPRHLVLRDDRARSTIGWHPSHVLAEGSLQW